MPALREIPKWTPLGRAVFRRVIMPGLVVTSMFGCGGSDATNPGTTPAPGTVRWEYATPDGLPLAAERDVRGQPYLYVAIKQGGVLVLRLNGSRPPTEAARISRSSLGNLDAMTLVQRGTQLFVGLGDLFAAQGARAGMAVVDVQSPEQPRVSARWVSPTVLNGSAALLVEGSNAFLGAMREGVFVFDVSQPDTSRRIATFLPDPNFPLPNPDAVHYPNARGLSLAGNRLYVADDAGDCVCSMYPIAPPHNSWADMSTRA